MRPRTFSGAALGVSLLAAVLLVASSAAKPSRAPHNRAAPKIAGAAVSGKALAAGRGRWSNQPRTFHYAWQSCNRAGKGCRLLPGAKRARYLLRARDVGHRMRVVVTAVNRHGRGSARSKATRAVAGVGAPAPPPPPGPPPGGGLHVSGNQLLNGSSQVVQLHGVNYSGTEFACIQGWGVFDGPSDAAMVSALAGWHVNVVHV